MIVDEEQHEVEEEITDEDLEEIEYEEEEIIEANEDQRASGSRHHFGPMPDCWIADKRKRLQSFCKRSKSCYNAVSINIYFWFYLLSCKGGQGCGIVEGLEKIENLTQYTFFL